MMFFAAFLLAILAVSCGKQTKTAPLEGNPALYTFATEAEDGKTILTGVANKHSGAVIIEPAAYKSITADAYTISCTEEDGMVTAYKTDGSLIGTFEIFTPWKGNGNYYLGVRYINKTYYFPKKDLIVSTQKVHNEYNVILLENADGWGIYDYEGNFLWQAPQNIGIIRNSKIPTKLLFAIESKGKRPSCPLYSEDGSAYKALSPTQWAKLKKTLKNVKEITSTAYAADTDDFDKI